MSKLRLVPGKKYWVSDQSEDEAREAKSSRRYIGKGSEGQKWFENVDKNNPIYTWWLFAVPIPGCLVMSRKYASWGSDKSYRWLWRAALQDAIFAWKNRYKKDLESQRKKNFKPE
jgi:hypothetical protein